MPGWLVATLVIAGIVATPFALVAGAWSLVAFGDWFFPGHGDGIAVVFCYLLLILACLVLASAMN